MFLLLSLGRYLAGGLLVLAGIIHPVVSAWEHTWFNRYIFTEKFLNKAIIIKTKVLLHQS